MSIPPSPIATFAAFIFAAVFFIGGMPAEAASKNGFDLADSLVPADEILQGGPPRDGIPAIDRPQFVAADAAEFIQDEDRILGVTIGNIAKAYPIRILNWHEIVNDSIGDFYFAVTYCPLCGSGVAFDSQVGERQLTFGVSGLLYNSDVLLYDRETGSLFSQILGQAVTGELKEELLTPIPLAHTTWGDWKNRHPQTLLLSADTGFNRDYNSNPYAGYEETPQTFFPVPIPPQDYHPKETVIGVNVGAAFKCYPYSELEKNGEREFTDTVNGEQLLIRWDSENRAGEIANAKGELIPVVRAFWFAWHAFHPDTKIFQAK